MRSIPFMRCDSMIDAYFSRLAGQIDACRIVITSTVTYDKRDPTRGFVRGVLRFSDGSALHFREFVRATTSIQHLVYAYQYMDVENRLIFRYDNAEHYPALPNAPHHKHAGGENTVVTSAAPRLDAVLAEVELMVSLD
jgi:hypothetical protein